MGDRSQRCGLVTDLLGALPVRGAGLDADRVANLHGLENAGELMASDVAEYAGAEIPPTAPGEGVIARVIRPHGRGALPEVPIQVRRAGWGLLGAGNTTLGDVRVAIGPRMHLLERADGSSPNQLGHAAGFFTGLSEITHLGSHLGLACEFTDHAGLINTVRERLLTVH